MERRQLFGILGAPFFAAAQTATPEGHGCTPPPAAGAPSLPARFLGGMGQVNFPITTANHGAQKYFEQGVAQLHSFWAREAERSFLMAASLDRNAPMPWWGVAMAAMGDYRPKFQQEHIDEVFGPQPRTTPRAWEAAQRAMELAKRHGALEPVEHLYIASIQEKCNPDHPNPDAAYVEGLRRILDRFPQEIEARLFLSLALMRGYTQPDKKPRAGTMESVEILRTLLPAAPQHPGLHHYIIHAYEGSSFAEEAWPSCEIYPRLAPQIPHALHMPGHIYAQTGKLKEAQAAFESCMRLELSYMAEDKQYGNGHHGHNVHFLAMVYSMDGQKEKALACAKHLLSYGDTPADAAKPDGIYGAYRQGFFASLRTIAQHELWDLAADKSWLPDIQQPRFQAWRHWLLALAAVHNSKDLKAAESHARSMDKSLGEFLRLTNFSVPEELVVARMELDGHLLWLRGRAQLAIEKLEQASQQEKQLRYTEPTWYPRPVQEVLARFRSDAKSGSGE